MSLWKKFFGKDEEPTAYFEHATLGGMLWSEDKESWVGRFGKLNFWIAYEHASTPKDGTLEYAASVLVDTHWLQLALDDIKNRAIRDYGPEYEEEINNLEFVTLSFHGDERLSIHFFEGNAQPWWVADVHGRNIEGVTLDT